MTYPGAGGETAAQMVRTVDLPSSVAQANAGFSALLKRLDQPNSYRKRPAYELFIANALWGQKTEDRRQKTEDGQKNDEIPLGCAQGRLSPSP